MKQYSLDDINAMVKAGDYVPTPDDAPVYDVPENFWENAIIVTPEARAIQNAIDNDILSWFAQHGGWQRMNEVLRSFIKQSSS